MSIFRRESRAAGSPFPEPIVPPFPGVSMFGSLTSQVGVDQAMQTSAVWACVRLLADSVAMMPVNAFTMRGNVRTPIPNPPLLVSPSADAPMFDWIYMIMVSLLLRGNAYGHIVLRDSAGYPVQIELWSPDAVHVTRDHQTGRVVYKVNGVTIPTEDVMHLRAFRFPGQVKGLSPITYAATAIRTDAAAAEFAYAFFRDGAHPSAVLQSDLPINQKQAREIKERFTTAVKGREPVALGAGVKYQQIQISPEESQFLLSRKYGVAEVSRIFGVPPEMIAAEAGNSLTYANVEQRGMDFLTYSVQPWLTRIEGSLARMLPGQKHVRFDTSALIRTDLETRMKSNAIAIASKQKTPDEARADSDLPPLTDAQKAELDMTGLEITPTGMPKALPKAPAPAAPASDEGEPA